MRSPIVLAVSLLGLFESAASRPADIFQRVKEIQRDASARLSQAPAQPALPFQRIQSRSADSKYLNNVTSAFVVNGSAVPDVTWDLGESYAGLLPISGAANETRKLFFWFFPSTNPDAGDEITIWLNGGPGCSSLSGLLTENGPFTWEAGTLDPVPNTYSWTNLTNMLWIEQPVGVGFSQGVPDITNEYELALEFIGFYKQFFDAFELHGSDTYVTGESYGGYYVPYIADAFLSHADDEYYKLKGIAINDPIIGDGNLQQEVVIAPYVDYWQNVFYLNSTFIDEMHARADQCGYTDFMNTYFKFPPPGPIPSVPQNGTEDYCDILDFAYDAILDVNPCFNIYHISETCPHPWAVLGIVNEGDYSPPGEVVYFNRTDVKKAINAPLDTNWEQCTENNVFAGNGSDLSNGPALNGVLAGVIEKTNNVIIGSGNLDFLLNTNGTLFAIQNMTWNGLQGLQEYPGQQFYVEEGPEFNGGSLGGFGNLGLWGEERGLTFYQIQLSGHELPGYAPSAAYKVVQKLLGHIDGLGPA
ncbi:serine carboxypeptidase [Microthyrium microscopicum]|uniref:Carboxypeptidase n=1 Tax=Microthyrium microscopicum TaxID=703497 RepID=A0A6A6UAA3_9PEZI|nr:serine carboxypeptidase [Microthyrium microscopicum]